MCAVLFEGHFLHWPEQIFVLRLKTDDLLQFLFLSQVPDINPSEEEKKEKAPLEVYCDNPGGNG